MSIFKLYNSIINLNIVNLYWEWTKKWIKKLLHNIPFYVNSDDPFYITFEYYIRISLIEI